MAIRCFKCGYELVVSDKESLTKCSECGCVQSDSLKHQHITKTQVRATLIAFVSPLVVDFLAFMVYLAFLFDYINLTDQALTTMIWLLVGTSVLSPIVAAIVYWKQVKFLPAPLKHLLSLLIIGWVVNGVELFVLNYVAIIAIIMSGKGPVC